MIKRVVATLAAVGVVGSMLITPAIAAPLRAGVTLNGAGSTFDFPFFDRAFHVYSAAHHITINYNAAGSGTGIQLFIAKQVDFGASDVPMDPTSDLKKATAAGGPVQQIAIALGGVAISYNLPGVKNALHLDGGTLADIYLGVITKWNDPAIKKLNKGVKLPSTTITPVYRSDSSGTSYAFTDFLSKTSDLWRGKVGTSKLPNWPAGVGAAKTQGVAGTVQATKGGIGYIELSYALQNHLKYAAMRNASGKYVKPSAASVAADAKAFPQVSARHFSIADGRGAKVYPISTYSWLLVYQHQADKAKGKAMVSLFKWMLSGAGQKYAGKLGYVPLPKKIGSIGSGQLKTVK